MVLSKALVFQFAKFCIVGVSNTIITLLVYYGMLAIYHNYIISNIASWLISVFNSYYWNNRYVFKNNNNKIIVLLKTYMAYGWTLVFSTLLLFFFIEICNISDKISPIIVYIITVPMNFIVNKYWTFK